MSKKQELVPDFSYLNRAAECGRKFQYNYEQNLVGRTINPYLWMGTAMHEALHTLYVSGWDLEWALTTLRETWGDYRPPRGNWEHLNLGTAEVVLRNYADDRANDGFKILEIEGETLAEKALVIDWDGIPYGGKIDLPVQSPHGGRYIMDFKVTSSWLTDWWGKKFELSYQFRGYQKIASVHTGQKIDGVYVMGVFVGKGATDPKEAWARRKSQRSRIYGPIMHSPAAIEETRDWAAGWLSTIEGWKRQGNFPQNIGQHCGNCDYQLLCKAHPSVRTQLAEQHFEQRVLTGKLASGADTPQGRGNHES